MQQTNSPAVKMEGLEVLAEFSPQDDSKELVITVIGAGNVGISCVPLPLLIQ